MRDVVAEKVDRLRAGDVPIFEPGLAELLAKNTERIEFTLDVAEAVEGAEFVFVCVDTPPLYSGDADLTRVDGDRRAAARRRRAGPGDEEHRAGGNRREGAECARPARADAGRVRLQPGVHRRRPRGGGLHVAGPDRDRRLRRGGRRPRRGAARTHRRAGRASGRELGRDDQARVERVPVDADQLRQRDCERLRARRRRRAEGRRGYGSRPPPRQVLPACGDRLRRELFPEGRVRVEAAGGEQRVPLPAAVGRDRGERAAEAARDLEAAAPSGGCAASRSLCSDLRSRQVQTTCERRRASCSHRG